MGGSFISRGLTKRKKRIRIMIQNKLFGTKLNFHSVIPKISKITKRIWRYPKGLFLFVFNVVPSNEEISFQPSSMVSISVIIHYKHYNLKFSMNLCVQLSMYFFVHLFLDMWVLILFYTSPDSIDPHYDDIQIQINKISI